MATQRTQKTWKQWNPEEARRSLERWRASGLPLAEYARQQGLATGRLWWWRRRLETGLDASGAGEAPSLAASEALHGAGILCLPRGARIYVVTEPCSLRRNFDGLSIEVRTALAKDPLSGHVFVFRNRRRTQVKLLLWTRGGFTVLHKRLERGTFTFPDEAPTRARLLELDVRELATLLEGSAVASRTSTRWEPPSKSCAE